MTKRWRILLRLMVALVLVVACVGFWSLSLGRKKGEAVSASEQAVIVSFYYARTDLTPLFDLEEQLEDAIQRRAVGVYDGNELSPDGSDVTLFMYGPDADRLFSVVRPILESSKVIKEAVATLQYRSPEDEVTEVEITIAGSQSGPSSSEIPGHSTASPGQGKDATQSE